MKKLGVTTLLFAILSSTSLLAMGVDEQALPASKRTSLGLYVTSGQAYEKWRADPENVKLIDVRTPEEFRLVGLPEMAAKVPLTTSAEEFVRRIRQYAGPEDTVLVICRSGNRSAVAVEMLAQAGFKNAYTVVDGFEGDKERNPGSPNYGKRTVNGWKNAELPWTKG
jgi:rhodanese-related sulfurtransferase